MPPKADEDNRLQRNGHGTKDVSIRFHPNGKPPSGQEKIALKPVGKAQDKAGSRRNKTDEEAPAGKNVNFTVESQTEDVDQRTDRQGQIK